MEIPANLKASYSLEEASARLTRTLGWPVSTKNVIEFCTPDDGLGKNKPLPLSVILRNKEMIERIKCCSLPNSFRYIYSAARDLNDVDCLNSIGGHSLKLIEYLSQLSSKEYKKANNNKSITTVLGEGCTLPEQSRLKNIMDKANDSWEENKRNYPRLLEAMYPSGIYFEEGHSALFDSEDVHVRIFNGVYQVELTRDLGEFIANNISVCDEIWHEGSCLRDFTIFDADGNTYQRAKYNGAKTEPFMSYYGLKSGLPPIETLVIQTKHLIEFESKCCSVEDSVNEVAPYANKKSPVYARELHIAVEAHEALFIRNEGNTSQSNTARISTWLNKHHQGLSNKAKERLVTVINPKK